MAEPVALSLADVDGIFFTQTLPPGSFQRLGPRHFIFRAPARSTGIHLTTITLTNSVEDFAFNLLGTHLDLRRADTLSVTVSLQIGNDAGLQTISCQVLTNLLKCQ